MIELNALNHFVINDSLLISGNSEIRRLINAIPTILKNHHVWCLPFKLGEEDKWAKKNNIDPLLVQDIVGILDNFSHRTVSMNLKKDLNINKIDLTSLEAFASKNTFESLVSKIEERDNLFKSGEMLKTSETGVWLIDHEDIGIEFAKLTEEISRIIGNIRKESDPDKIWKTLFHRPAKLHQKLTIIDEYLGISFLDDKDRFSYFEKLIQRLNSEEYKSFKELEIFTRVADLSKSMINSIDEKIEKFEEKLSSYNINFELKVYVINQKLGDRVFIFSPKRDSYNRSIIYDIGHPFTLFFSKHELANKGEYLKRVGLNACNEDDDIVSLIKDCRKTVKKEKRIIHIKN